MAWYGYFLLGVVAGLISMYLIVKSSFGSTYKIDNKFKIRKSNVGESSISNQLPKEVKKEPLLKRLFNKKQKS